MLDHYTTGLLAKNLRLYITHSRIREAFTKKNGSNVEPLIGAGRFES
jgi:hypothetical protein